MAADKKSKKEKKARKAEKKAARKAEKQAARQSKLAKRTGRTTAKAARKTAKGTRKAAAAGKRALRERRQPETLRLRSASPSFTVNDLQKSLAFYRDVLGFTEGEHWERDGTLHGVELVAGRVSLFLAQDDWQKGRDRVKGQGFRVYCDTVQDIDALARRIQERGGTLAEEPKDRPWGGRDFAVADPDGFKITISTES
jgi:catechol 2,3-dioxygenase-like lactoylglutathione lyase family enzyme